MMQITLSFNFFLWKSLRKRKRSEKVNRHRATLDKEEVKENSSVSSIAFKDYSFHSFLPRRFSFSAASAVSRTTKTTSSTGTFSPFFSSFFSSTSGSCLDERINAGAERICAETERERDKDNLCYKAKKSSAKSLSLRKPERELNSVMPSLFSSVILLFPFISLFFFSLRSFI